MRKHGGHVWSRNHLVTNTCFSRNIIYLELHFQPFSNGWFSGDFQAFPKYRFGIIQLKQPFINGWPSGSRQQHERTKIAWKARTFQSMMLCPEISTSAAKQVQQMLSQSHPTPNPNPIFCNFRRKKKQRFTP